MTGETIHILGGGPSLAGLDKARLGADVVIAVNNAGLDVMPEAHVLLVMDRRWFDWNRDRLHLNRSPVCFVRQNQFPKVWELKATACAFDHDKHADLSHTRGMLAGACGGAAAINLAFLMGATRIVLHGFDMRPGNYHADHRVETPDHLYRDVFIPSLERMAAALPPRVEVVNATPGSALTCFPMLEPA